VKASERHKLKHDKYADAVALGIEWARKHRTAVLVAIAVILFGCACAVWITLAKQSAERDAYETFIEVEKIRFNPAEADEQEVNRIVNRCENIAEDYPGTTIAPQALLRAAQVLAQAGRTDEAIPAFQRTITAAAGRPGLNDIARRGLAQAFEDAGKLEKAIENYQLLIHDELSPASAQAYWDIGRCYHKLEKATMASEYFNRAISVAPDSAWAEMSRFCLAGFAAASGAPLPPSSATTGATPPKPPAQPPEDK